MNIKDKENRDIEQVKEINDKMTFVPKSTDPFQELLDAFLTK